MSTLTIDPVTRIEGHAKISIETDNDKVTDAKLHVTQYRGFEKICQGRPYTEMPSLTARTCGICPVSHLIASAKACDELLAVRPPKAGRNLRRIINLAQLLQSHTLNFYHLSAPDLVYGMDAAKEDRNIFKMMQTHPQMAKEGIALRAFGQSIIEKLGGKRIHPSYIVPGGVSHALDSDTKQEILAQLPEAMERTQKALTFFKEALPRFQDEIAHFGNFDSMYMAMVNKKGQLEHYDGFLRFMDAGGNIVADGVEPRFYKDYIGEAVEGDSYLKSPYYKPLGYPRGMYRVGPLARLNVADSCGTPEADKHLADFKALGGGKPVKASFYYHYARLIEMIYAIEKIEELLRKDSTADEHVRSHADINRLHGVGCSEAPRGTLFHDYSVDKNGLIQKLNLIIATGNNNLAMNAAVKQVAQRFVDPADVTDGDLNRVEAVIRSFDPCLSCSTHALGIISNQIEITDKNGKILQRIDRN